ncbi:WHG domain-containing protein [Micromonospora sp. NPDC049645]|uniref:TetR/AcrR family transcriptional regulator n=1 Tax=Micromonospora sp. NPDC049645 TaxID=3155508 RepID=UPI00341F2C5A
MPRARLTPASVTEAAAALVDEVGFDNLSMGLLAERLGIKTPSLYKHVSSQADLAHRVAILALHEAGDAIRDAIQGRSGSDALAAGARAMRAYVREHPGRYAAANAVRPAGPDDPLIPASERVLASWAAMLSGYGLDPGQEIHAMRTLRSVLHGFATLEAAGGFQIDASVDESFTWLVSFLDQGFRAGTTVGAVGPAAGETGH